MAKYSFLLSLFCYATAQLPNSNSEWDHELILDLGVMVRWNSSHSEDLFMEMSAPTSGYVAVGFSPNGGMPGSDIVMGWVDSDGRPHIAVNK